jgi:alpha-L-arabinofuranosidase
VQWNVAGWNNTQSAIQTNDAIAGTAVRHRIESDRWYDLKLEVRDRTVRGYVDGQLINEATLPRIDTVLAIAGHDDKTGEIVIKAINTAPHPAAMTINLRNVRHYSSTGRLIVMSSLPEEENSFEDPKRIVPVERVLSGVGPAFTHELPPYSLSILRLGARQR